MDIGEYCLIRHNFSAVFPLLRQLLCDATFAA